MQPMKARLQSLENPIQTVIIGIGSIGKGLAYQCHLTRGFSPVAIADVVLEKAIACAEWLDVPFEVVQTKAQLAKTIQSGKLAVCQDGLLAASAEGADVVIEASNAVYEGALHALTAIEHGKHVVMMNYEAELMYGPYLLAEADAQGVTYTCADGDQPTAIKQLVDDIQFWGFDLVMLGNMKGFHDLYTDPEKIAPEADKRNLDHKMCSSYTDGSKLCVEMASLANALNGRVHKPGMIGPKIGSIHDIFDHINFAEIWKPGDRPLVDYVLGARPRGGVFAIGYTEDTFQQFTLSWFPPDMGPGPFYLFYRPYHLGHIEALNCVAEAYLDGTARLAPKYGIQTNVFCYAKRDLEPGDVIDGMGGYTTYGLIENVGGLATCELEGVPQLISEGWRVNRAIKKDERIALQDCEYDSSAPSFTLYRETLKIGPKDGSCREEVGVQLNGSTEKAGVLAG